MDEALEWEGHPKCPFEGQKSPTIHKEKIDPASLPVAGQYQRKERSFMSGHAGATDFAQAPPQSYGEGPDFARAPPWQPVGRSKGAAGRPRRDQGDLVLG